MKSSEDTISLEEFISNIKEANNIFVYAQVGNRQESFLYFKVDKQELIEDLCYIEGADTGFLQGVLDENNDLWIGESE